MEEECYGQFHEVRGSGRTGGEGAHDSTPETTHANPVVLPLNSRKLTDPKSAQALIAILPPAEAADGHSAKGIQLFSSGANDKFQCV